MSSAPAAENWERTGRRLQWATIAWNTGEVVVTVALGLAAGSLALIAFGLDSLVEVFTSLVVVWHMQPGAAVEAGAAAQRERRALRLVAGAFTVLAIYLLVASARSLILREHAGSSPAGIAYLAATAVVMFGLAEWKRRVGQRLRSEPFRAEAAMTFLDGCLSTGILVALILNTALHWWWADPLAAALVGVVAAREGWERWHGTGVSPASPSAHPAS